MAEAKREDTAHALLRPLTQHPWPPLPCAGMELFVTRATLQVQGTDIRNIRKEMPVQLPFAKATFRFMAAGLVAESAGDWWLGGSLSYDCAAPKDMLAAWAISCRISTVARDGRRQLLKAWSGNAAGKGWCREMPLTLFQLRDMVNSGTALEATWACVECVTPVGAGAALRVPSPAGSLSAQHLYEGPLSDVAIVCGGRRFEAHRAVLAIASPVFLSMFTSDMAEGGAAPEVEIKEADPAALELLLRHAYGAAVDVRLALAPQLYGLADRFQLRTDLGEKLELWLSTVDVEPSVLVDLLPAAHTLCPAVCRVNLYSRAADECEALITMPAFGGWPVELVLLVVEQMHADSGFKTAAPWMAAQERPAKQRHHWPALLDAVQFTEATREQLGAIRAHSGAAAVPGLQERLLDAYDELCGRLA